ncbi:class I SAM-dependent methyltransferase family protein [Methanohalobium sp.]|uniref:class I SAM-dependent methyltransferase n=1 Tax=Methanohalobium sp. TaxID=2837493 RepID=UPI0025DBCC8C|nr:class I SAM-dependent methyltransferase family protein [Methanohalobium sp.]
MNKAILIPKEKVEYIRCYLSEKCLLDRSRKIKRSKKYPDKYLEIPVNDDVDGYKVIEQDEPEYYKPVTSSLKEKLSGYVPETEIQHLPTGWQVLGNLIIVRIPEELEHRKKTIAYTLLEMYPKCRSVVEDFGIEGQFRRPKRKLIIGNETETIHKENQCYFKLDVADIMYSKGNLDERQRMSKLGEDELVVDMFSGIGYFSIPMAVHSKPKKLISIEINPISFKYLQENINLNRVDGTVIPVCGDCSLYTPENTADRVLMGYVRTTHYYLKYGIKALKESGGMLHYHETVPENRLYERPVSRIKNVASEFGRTAQICGHRTIKKYSPGVYHVVVDAYIYKPK